MTEENQNTLGRRGSVRWRERDKERKKQEKERKKERQNPFKINSTEAFHVHGGEDEPEGCSSCELEDEGMKKTGGLFGLFHLRLRSIRLLLLQEEERN